MKRGSPYDQVAGRDEITPLKKKISFLDSRAGDAATGMLFFVRLPTPGRTRRWMY